MRVRFALAVGAALLVGGAVTGGAVAFAADAPPSVTQPAPSATGAPTAAPSQDPSGIPGPPRQATTAAPGAPRVTTAPGKRAAHPRVPTAVPAGPTGDLHLPAVWG